MKESKKLFLARLAILWVLVIAAMVVVYKVTSTPLTSGKKDLTIVVTHSDLTEKTFNIKTRQDYLGRALLEDNKLDVAVREGSYGIFITMVDGEWASDDSRTYWRISQDGEDLMVGADSQPIQDGEHYEFTLSTY